MKRSILCVDKNVQIEVTHIFEKISLSNSLCKKYILNVNLYLYVSIYKENFI